MQPIDRWNIAHIIVKDAKLQSIAANDTRTSNFSPSPGPHPVNTDGFSRHWFPKNDTFVPRTFNKEKGSTAFQFSYIHGFEGAILGWKVGAAEHFVRSFGRITDYPSTQPAVRFAWQRPAEADPFVCIELNIGIHENDLFAYKEFPEAQLRPKMFFTAGRFDAEFRVLSTSELAAIIKGAAHQYPHHSQRFATSKKKILAITFTMRTRCPHYILV